MRKLTAFEQVSLDGYFVDGNGDMSWAHKQDPEWNEYVAGNASGEGVLAFGRVTYEQMAGFWPTPAAMERAPVVAKAMTEMPKVVFSRTLAGASWKNTRVLRGELVPSARSLKAEKGPDVVILGSGSVVSQLAAAGLIDELQVVVNPIVLGKGRTLFEGVSSRIGLRRTLCRAFSNGNVVVHYQPMA